MSQYPQAPDIDTNLIELGLTSPAAGFLLLLWDAIQFLDDVHDSGLTERKSVEMMCDLLLVQLPLCQYYAQNAFTLVPAIRLAVAKWSLANRMEESHTSDARSYMWRAGFYDVLAVVCILEGVDPTRALLCYGETYEDYVKEFDHA